MKNRLFVITGMSGAGKTTTMNLFEELDYYCIENLPLELIENFAKLIVTDENKYKNVAISIPINDYFATKTILERVNNFDIYWIVLDCSKEVLFNRFRLTRHIHPLQMIKKLSLDDAIDIEKDAMNKINKERVYFYDTTGLTESNLKFLVKSTSIGDEGERLTVHFYSFGFKRGLPSDCDVLFDARVLPNPYYIEQLKHQTGLDEEVKQYIFACKEYHEMLSTCINYLEFYINKSNENGRRYLNIAIGCSGGQHRSVVVANSLYEYFENKYKCLITHRDIRWSNK